MLAPLQGDPRDLQPLQKSHHYFQRYQQRHSVPTAASIYSDIYAPLPRYAWFRDLAAAVPPTLPQPSVSMKWHAVSFPPLAHAHRWEREGLGYPSESDVIQAVADGYFAHQQQQQQQATTTTTAATATTTTAASAASSSSSVEHLQSPHAFQVR